MKNIKNIFIDTNVLLDVLLEREPFSSDAAEVFDICRTGSFRGYASAHSFPDIFYILRKDYSVKQRKEMLLSLYEMVGVVGASEYNVIDALKNADFSDFEDCLQSECARSVNAKYIITRNVKDFTASPIAAITPTNFLRKYKEV